jgi:eukaryotic-like serine/threonine-protein kinase
MRQEASISGWASSRCRVSRPAWDETAGQDSSSGDGAARGDGPTERSLSDLNTGSFVRSPDLVAPGHLLDGRFRLRQLLGHGGMGQVYAAYDERLKVDVAIKLLLPEVARSRRYLEKLHTEIVSARRVSHPNVCRVHDLGKSGGIHFISMEIVAGRTLEEALQRQRFSTRAALRVLRQITAGLDAAHRCGVIHRDLKPANIMINACGHVTMMDFGLARDLNCESTEREGRSGAAVGTPAYWSPEQSRGEPSTPASDLFSLGLIACRLFAGKGRHPEREDAIEVVPAAYRAVIARCLEPNPAARYSSAEAVHLALRVARRDARPSWTAYGLGALVGLATVAVGSASLTPTFGMAPEAAAATAFEVAKPSATPPAALVKPVVVEPEPSPRRIASAAAATKPPASQTRTLAPRKETEVLRHRVPVFD